MTEINNPFSEMLISLKPERFFGRHSDIKLLLQGVSSREPRSFAIQGVKTIGKTSLLKRLRERETDEADFNKFLVEYGPGQPGQLEFLYIDFYQIEGKDVLFKLYRKLKESSHYEPVLETLPNSQMSNADDTVKADSDESEIRERINRITSALRKKNVRLVICMDHFDKAFKSMIYTDDVFLRNITNSQSFIITTEEGLADLRQAPHITSALLPLLIVRNLALLNEGEARNLIMLPAEEVEKPFTDEETLFLLEIAGRQPYLLTIICEQFFKLRMLHPEIREALPKDKGIRQQLLLQMESVPAVANILSFFWNQLQSSEKRTLLKIASGHSIDIEMELPALRSLQQKALISDVLQQDKKYDVFSGLFREYVRRQSLSSKTQTSQSLTSSLAPLDGRLLEYLTTKPNQICTFDELMAKVWADSNSSKGALDAAIYRLRDKLQRINETDHEYIENIRGKGYKYNPKI